MPNWLQYELQACEHHAQTYGHTVYHWSNVPEDVLINSGFVSSHHDWRLLRKAVENNKQMREFGLDGIAVDKDGVCHGIQAKCWNETLCASDLGSFLSVMHGRFKKNNSNSKGYLYHTTKIQRDLWNDLNLMDNIIIKSLPFEIDAAAESSSSEGGYIGHIQRNEADFDLHPPQKEALDALMLAYETGWSGPQKLKLPCGMGKTLVTAQFLQNISPDCVIIASPLRIHATQTLQRVSKFMPNHVPILVDSDSDGMPAHMLDEFIKDKDRVLISTTYDSYELIKHVPAFVVFDEAHNLNEEQLDEIEDLPMSLLLTATPPNLLDDVPTVFEYSMRAAIDNKYICDYQIHLPVMEEVLIPEELERHDQTPMCLFLLSGMLETGAAKCIVYLSSQAECRDFTKEFAVVAREYHGIDVFAKIITSETAAKDRKQIIQEFSSNGMRISVIASVRILNEGVDIPECDSIMLTHTAMTEITAVQRLSRANRKTRYNPNKVANAFIYCDDVDSGASVLTTLKYDDPEFLSKIRLISANYDTKSDAAEVCKKKEQLPAVVEKTKEKIQVRSQVYEDNIKERIQKIEEFFVKEERRPNKRAEGEKTLGIQLTNMEGYYKKNQYMMKNPELNELWTQLRVKFSQHFDDARWDLYLSEAQAWIDAKGKPIKRAKDEVEKRIGMWINKQQQTYKNNIMVKNNRAKWAAFVAKNAEVLMTQEEFWQHNLQKSQTFMREHKRRPSVTKAGEEVLGRWLSYQITGYNNKTMREDRRLQIEELQREFPLLIKLN